MIERESGEKSKQVIRVLSHKKKQREKKKSRDREERGKQSKEKGGREREIDERDRFLTTLTNGNQPRKHCTETICVMQKQNRFYLLFLDLTGGEG